MAYTFEVDEDTQLIIDSLLSKFLVKYFGFPYEKIQDSINFYYEYKTSGALKKNDSETIDLLFHHDHPYFVAAHIYFVNNNSLMNQYNKDFTLWLQISGHNTIPHEAIEAYQNWLKS